MPKRRPPQERRKPSDMDILVGENLRRVRQLRGKTLVEAASSIGISHQQLQKYESGTNRISVGALLEASRYLSMPIEDLFRDPEPSSANSDDPASRSRHKCHAIIDRTEELGTLNLMEKVLRALPEG